MGEVVVRVKLTNLADWVLAEEGGFGTPRSVEVDAVIDSGDVRSRISQRVCDELGLRIRAAFTSRSTANDADVALGITFEVLGREAVASASVVGDEVRIGQTVLAELDLVVDTGRGLLIPNPSHPDGPVLPLRSPRPTRP